MAEVKQGVIGNLEEEESVKKPKRKKRQIKKMGLNINSMMDIMTIILVFLIKSYSTNPVNVTPTDDLQIPTSMAKLQPEDAVPITVTKRSITVNDDMVVEVKDYKIEPQHKRDGADGFFIDPLFEALSIEMEKQKEIARFNKAQEFRGLSMIIMDSDVPCRLLTEVMYTAGQAQFSNFKFVVVQDG